MAKVNTGDTSREIAGVGSVINTHHEGTTKRPTERKRLDEITADDMGNGGQESEMPNPTFGQTVWRGSLSQNSEKKG